MTDSATLTTDTEAAEAFEPVADGSLVSTFLRGGLNEGPLTREEAERLVRELAACFPVEPLDDDSVEAYAGALTGVDRVAATRAVVGMQWTRSQLPTVAEVLAELPDAALDGQTAALCGALDQRILRRRRAIRDWRSGAEGEGAEGLNEVLNSARRVARKELPGITEDSPLFIAAFERAQEVFIRAIDNGTEVFALAPGEAPYDFAAEPWAPLRRKMEKAAEVDVWVSPSVMRAAHAAAQRAVDEIVHGYYLRTAIRRQLPGSRRRSRLRRRRGSRRACAPGREGDDSDPDVALRAPASEVGA